jgi:serine/threonine-protein kinase
MLTKDNDYIIRTFDFLDEGDKITIVMEYIDGCSLKDIIEKEKGIPIDYAMYFFKKIVLGVNDLHNVFQHQIIHRDLKPENVLISSDFNTIKIIDFGISTIIVNDGEKQKILSDEKDLIGTYDYISPNALHFRQADKSGKEKINVNQFDIFSLGIILYEMLAGETPFNVEKAEDIELPAKYDVPCLSETIPDVPPCIDNIIFKCVAYQQKDQTFLYKNIQELLNDIIRYETNDDDVLNEKLIKPAINRIYHNKKIFNIEIEKSKIKFFETS